MERTREVLAEQGFGILTGADTKATFAAKLGSQAAADADTRLRAALAVLGRS